MQLFHPEARNRSPQHRRIYALYEVWYTTVDFAAAFAFLAGSVLFFWKSTQYAATWFFVIGSICFALKPTIRLARELRYLELGKIEILAKREEG